MQNKQFIIKLFLSFLYSVAGNAMNSSDFPLTIFSEYPELIELSKGVYVQPRRVINFFSNDLSKGYAVDKEVIVNNSKNITTKVPLIISFSDFPAEIKYRIVDKINDEIIAESKLMRLKINDEEDLGSIFFFIPGDIVTDDTKFGIYYTSNNEMRFLESGEDGHML